MLVVEPGDTTRWIEIRADAQPDPRDPAAHLDELALAYTGTAPYLGRMVPAHLAETEHPILYRLVPTAVRTGPMWVHGHRPVPDRSVPAPQRPWSCHGEPAIPASHCDLLDRPLVVALSTRMPDGWAQTQPVWCSRDGNDVLVNTTRQRRKGRNLIADPRASVLAVDPGNAGRWIEIRGDVELVHDGAQEHLGPVGWTIAFTAGAAAAVGSAIAVARPDSHSSK